MGNGLQSKAVSARQESEGGLVDLWLLVVRRKGLLFGVFTVVVAATAILFFFAEPVYESRAVLIIGTESESKERTAPRSAPYSSSV